MRRSCQGKRVGGAHRLFPGMTEKKFLLAFAFAVLIQSSIAAQNLPSTAAESLSGHKMEFPAALAGHVAVCVFGFSKEAGDRGKPWMKRLNQDGINAWSVANLEKAPSFVRGMIRSSMRKGTPASQLDHFLILTKDAKAWEQAVGSKHDSLPVVVLLDAGGRIVWAYEGDFAAQPYQELRQHMGAAQ